MKSNKKGFTLIEVVIVVLIVMFLAAMALPNYNRSIEKSRAVEAMSVVKAANDAVYAYAAERGVCPSSFDKLVVNIQGTRSNNGTVITSKFYTYTLNAATKALIPTTQCGGVVAYRPSVGYRIWNPYKIINTETKKHTLACTGTSDKARALCQSLKIFTSETPF